MPRVFGTDGVRGLANREVTAELALDLSVAAARVIIDRGDVRPAPASDRSRWSVATRGSRGSSSSTPSSPGWPRPASTCCGSGCCPRPGVAYLTAALDADLGVVISASHNPMPDNGIKFLARGGLKLDDAVEAQIEELLGSEWDAADRRRGRPGRAPTSARSRSTSTTCSPRSTAR